MEAERRLGIDHRHTRASRREKRWTKYDGSKGRFVTSDHNAPFEIRPLDSTWGEEPEIYTDNFA
jgi:hypothetical protein